MTARFQETTLNFRCVSFVQGIRVRLRKARKQCFWIVPIIAMEFLLPLTGQSSLAQGFIQSSKEESKKLEEQKHAFKLAHSVSPSKYIQVTPKLEQRTEVKYQRPRPHTKFDSAKWRHDRYLETLDRRVNMVKDLLQNYKLKGITRSELYTLLGAPDKSLEAFARYDVFASSETEDEKVRACLDFAFANNVVTDFRFVSGQNRHSWKDVSRKAQADLKRCNPDYASLVIYHHPWRHGNVRSTVELPLSYDDALLETGMKHSKLGLNAYWKPRQLKHHDQSAVRAFQKFLEMYPDEIEVWRELGRAELALKHFDAAIKDYSQVIEVSPGYADYEKRATANLKLGRLDDAIADYTSSIDLQRRRVAELSHRKIFDLRNRLWYSELLAVRAYSYRAVAHLKNGQPDLAIADLDDAIKVRAYTDLPVFIRGEFFLNQSKYDKAIADFTEIIRDIDKRTTTARTVFEERARAYEKLGQPMYALSDWNSAKSCAKEHHPELKWILSYLNYGESNHKSQNR